MYFKSNSLILIYILLFQKTRVMYHQSKRKCIAVNPQTFHISLMSCDPINTYQQWSFKEIHPNW